MLRTSSYTIYVALPDNDSEVLLVHGYTGAFDRVSRSVASYLRSLESSPVPRPLYGEWLSEVAFTEEPQEASEEALSTLKRRGYLTELPPGEEAERFSAFATKVHAKAMAARPSYLFMPTYNCNLRCSYCFQDHMRTNPAFHHLLRVMPKEMVDRIFLGMLDVERALPPLEEGEKRRRRIGFFGGEPLLAETRPIVEYIMRKALDFGTASFWAVSNATELDAYEDVLGPDGISELQITLDGPPEEHDRRRIYADGSGSYVKIMRNVRLALGRGVQVSARVNVDRNNVGMLPAMADDLVARGLSEHPNFSLYTAPIWVANEKTDRKTTFNSWELDQAILRLREEFANMAIVSTPDDRIKAQVRKIFDEQYDPLPSFRASYCGAHSNMYIFDSFGDIYACWEHTGDAKIRIGKIESDGRVDLNVDMNQMWRGRTVASNPVCSRCRYALYCGGGCAIRALELTGKFNMNFCDAFQKRFCASVADAYLDHMEGRQSLRQQRVCDL